jgi:hypothetical protein
MRRIAAALLAAMMGGNGLVMLVAGLWWYGAVPGVTTTGPYNPHFVQDTGVAFLVAAAGFAAFVARPAQAWGAAAAGAAFLIGHAAVHLMGLGGAHHAGHDFLRDLPGVYLPAVMAGFVIFPERRSA